jgi:glycosyltransferase involved in cell wall biosynthesis
VFRAFAEDLGWDDVAFVSLRAMPARRLKLGWVTPPHGSMPLSVLDDESWRYAVDKQLDTRRGVHIVNGVYHDERVAYVAKRLASDNRSFGVIMEAPSNLDVGLKRIAKTILAPIITPMRTWSVARKASFVLSASGDRQKAFERLGFERDRIFPFGYFPNFPYVERGEASASELRVLCIGYLEPFKGQDCLIQALSLLRARGAPFSCAITGFGSAAEDLHSLRDRLGLQGDVSFEGVVSNERLSELFRWANVLVAPGFEEPWGIRVNEALLSGLPVVVSDGVGARELVDASGAGEVFTARSASSLADAMQRALERLQSGDLMETVRRFRPRIEPKSAALYIAQVIDYVEKQSEATSRGVVEPRPSPPWFERQAL